MSDFQETSSRAPFDDAFQGGSKYAQVTRLRPYQELAHADVLDFLLTGHQRVALISATGSGKTTIILSLLARLKILAETGRGPFTGAIVVAPQKQIVDGFDLMKNPRAFEICGDRTVANVPTFLEGNGSLCRPVGAKQQIAIAKHLKATRPRSPFALATGHQTLSRFKTKGMPRDLSGKLLVVDEGHHVSTEKEVNAISDVVRTWVARGGYVLIVTATPFRNDGKSVLDEEGWVAHHRTIATHAADRDENGMPYVPQNLRVEHQPLKGYVVKNYQQLTGEEGAKNTGGAEAQIVRRWIKDGRPKLAVIVPSKGSRAWTSRVMAAFRKAGARPFDAVGTDTATKQRTRAMLTSEQKVTCLKDSQVDVFVACRRFDEGTDWPLCSHIYVVGFPSNLPTSIQRWGRTFRAKTGILGHTHLDDACITFFVPEWTAAVSADLSDKKMTTRHRDAAILLACHLHDYKTGGEYAANVSLFDRIRTPGRSGYRSLDRHMERIASAVEMDAAQRSRARADVMQIKAKVGQDPTKVFNEITSKMDSWDEGRVFNALTCWYETGLKHADLDPLTKQRLVDTLARAAKRCAVELPKTSSGNLSPNKGVIRKHLREAFERAIKDFAHLTFNDEDEGVLRTVSMWTGETVVQVCARLKEEAESHEGHDLKKIEQGIGSFVKAKGKCPPSSYGGDATKYVGYKTTWTNVDSWLRTQGTSLTQLCKEMGFQPRFAKHDLKKIEKGIKAFVKAKGVCPSSKDGNASAYVGYMTTWKNIDSWLMLRAQGTSLSRICKKLGFQARFAKHGLGKIKYGIASFFKAENKCPSSTSGDATKYVGYKTTWTNVDSWLRTQGISLTQLCKEMAFQTRHANHDLKKIEKGIKAFVKAKGECPTKRTGDATKYTEYKTTWSNVNCWLRRQGSSLAQLCKKLGPR